MTRHLFLDYETFPIIPGVQAPPPVCMSYRWDREKTRLAHVRDPEFRAVLREALDSDTILVAFRAAFELLVTLAYEPRWVGKLFGKLRRGHYRCVLDREKLIRIAKGDKREFFNLEDLAADYKLPYTIDKSFEGRGRYGELIDVPLCDWPQPYIDYSLIDTDGAADIYWLQENHPAAWLVNQHDTMRADVALALTSAHGFPTDPHAAKKLMVETEERLELYKQQLLEAGLAEWKKDKGELKVALPKKPAEELIVKAYAKLGLEAPRGEPTETALLKVYKEAGEKPPEKYRNELDLVRDLEKRGGEIPLGNLKLDAEACEGAQDDLLFARTTFAQARTLRGKVLRLQKPLIQTYYNVLVSTGRTSCSQGDDPEPGEAWMAYGMQVQNLPRSGQEIEGSNLTKPGARECFVAPGYVQFMQDNPLWYLRRAQQELEALRMHPEWCIVSVDFDAFEMRTWAQVCYWWFRFSALRDILNDVRRCPHIEMGVRLREQLCEGSTWEEQYAWGYGLKAAKDAESKALLKAVRGLAKGPNFGLPGGMGWKKLIIYCWQNYGVRVSPELAQLACAVWRELYPEAQPYLDEIKNIVGKKYGSRSTITQLVSGRVRGDVGFTDGANGFFQALAADIAKAAGWRLIEEAYENASSPLYGCRPLAFVHDEWLYAIPRNRINTAGPFMAKVMTDTAMSMCPDLLFTASAAAMYRWSKAAGDPYYNKDGELIPYEEAKGDPFYPVAA